MSTRRVFAWQTDTAGCFHYRIELPFAALNSREGWQCRYGAPGPDIHDYDVVVGQRIAGPSPEWEALCRDPSVLAVYDMDDDLINIEPENEIPYRIYHPLRADTIRNVEMADVVTTCMPAITALISRYNPNVRELPICIPAAVIDLPEQHGEGDPLLGWVGSMFQAQNWAGMPEILATYAERRPGAKFHSIGADYLGHAFAGRKRVTGWTSMDRVYRSIDFDLGIAPLNPALHGSQVRSWTKPLQYAARGVPVIATGCGQYVDWVEDGINGFLAGEVADWVELLIHASDPTVRASMGAAARAKAHRYTIEANIGLWETAYGG